MIRLKMKNYNTISREKLQNYHEATLISMNILQVKKYCLVIKITIIAILITMKVITIIISHN